MKSLSVTIQTKAIEKYFRMVLFVLWDLKNEIKNFAFSWLLLGVKGLCQFKCTTTFRLGIKFNFFFVVLMALVMAVAL